MARIVDGISIALQNQGTIPTPEIAAVRLEKLAKEDLVRLLEAKHALVNPELTHRDFKIGEPRPGQTLRDRLEALDSSEDIINVIESAVKANSNDSILQDLGKTLNDLREYFSRSNTAKIFAFIKTDKEFSGVKYPATEVYNLGISKDDDTQESIKELKNLSKLRKTLEADGVDPNSELGKILIRNYSASNPSEEDKALSVAAINQRKTAVKTVLQSLSPGTVPSSYVEGAEEFVSQFISDDSKHLDVRELQKRLDLAREFCNAAALYGFSVRSSSDLTSILDLAAESPDFLQESIRLLRRSDSQNCWKTLSTNFPKFISDISTFENFADQKAGFIATLASIETLNIGLSGKKKNTERYSLKLIADLIKRFGKDVKLDNDQFLLTEEDRVQVLPPLEILDDKTFPQFLYRYLLEKSSIDRVPFDSAKIESISEMVSVANLFAYDLVYRNISNLGASMARYIPEKDLQRVEKLAGLVKKFIDLGFDADTIAFPAPFGNSVFGSAPPLEDSKINPIVEILEKNRAVIPQLKHALFGPRESGGWGFQQMPMEVIAQILGDQELRDFYSKPGEYEKRAKAFHRINDALKEEKTQSVEPLSLTHPRELRDILKITSFDPIAKESEMRRIRTLLPELRSPEGITQGNLPSLLELLKEDSKSTLERELKHFLDSVENITVFYGLKIPFYRSAVVVKNAKSDKSLATFSAIIEDRETKDLFNKFRSNKTEISDLTNLANLNFPLVRDFLNRARVLALRLNQEEFGTHDPFILMQLKGLTPKSLEIIASPQFEVRLRELRESRLKEKPDFKGFDLQGILFLIQRVQ